MCGAGHQSQSRAPALKCAALEDSRMMLSITGGTLDLRGGVIIPHQSIFAEVATYNGYSGNRACVDEPDHSRDITGKGALEFRTESPSNGVVACGVLSEQGLKRVVPARSSQRR